jgi:DNA-directed RNA polymerase specialized sigma24 family protein
VDELQIEEIAEITGKGNVSVRVTLHRALKKLKKLSGSD